VIAPTPSDVTVAICARNAAATIARAVRSALTQGGPVVLVDDGSTDETAAIARAVGGAAVRIVRPALHTTLGQARAHAVAVVQTTWLQWLDADDELIDGRAAVLLEHATARRCDAVWDGAQLCDGPTGRTLRALPMPAFMTRPGAAVRLFERNHVPGPAWPLVRTDVARRVGYDPALPTADDLDFMLRACCQGASLGFSTDCGYRQYAYPASVSRDRRHQRAWVAAVLRKHAYDDVRARYRAAGLPAALAAWALVSMASFRDEWPAALAFVDEACPAPASGAVLEPEGPWPWPESWRRAFHRGTLLLHVRGADAREAARELERAEAQRPTPEGANNLGVALARLGRCAEAADCLAAALSRRPGYADARANLEAAVPTHVTTHPLRHVASRSEYV
jgi:hypothetical protein